MGTEFSVMQRQHAKELQQILRQGGTVVSLTHLKELLKEIECQCPWYPEKGSLKVSDWIEVGNVLHTEPRAQIQHLLLWQKCTEALERVIPKAPSKTASIIAPVHPPPDPPLKTPASLQAPSGASANLTSTPSNTQSAPPAIETKKGLVQSETQKEQEKEPLTPRKLHAKELLNILKQQGGCETVSLIHVEKLLHEIGRLCPWYPESGTLQLEDWVRIGTHLYSEPQAPTQHLKLWQRCKDALGKVKPEASPSFLSEIAPVSQSAPQLMRRDTDVSHSPLPSLQLLPPSQTASQLTRGETHREILSQLSETHEAFEEERERETLDSDEFLQSPNNTQQDATRETLHLHSSRVKTTHSSGQFVIITALTPLPTHTIQAISHCIMETFQKLPASKKPSKPCSKAEKQEDRF